MNTEQDSELEDLFDDIRQTCQECEHPRCTSIIESAKATILAWHNKLIREAEVRGARQEVEMLDKAYHNAVNIEGYIMNRKAQLPKESTEVEG